MRPLLFLGLAFVLITCLHAGAPPPSTSRNKQKALAASEEASFEESQGNEKNDQLLAEKQDAQMKQAYKRDKNQNLDQAQNHNLDQNMKDDSEAARKKRARESSDLDKGKHKIQFSRDKSKGASSKDRIKIGDRGVDDQGEFENHDKQSFGNQKYGQKERNGALWQNQDFDQGKSKDRTSSKRSPGITGGSGGAYDESHDNMFNRGQSTKFGNNNDFDLAAQKGWGNKESSNKGAYNKKQWDKNLEKDSAKTNHDDDSIRYLNDKQHTKAANRKALDDDSKMSRNRAANKSVKDNAYKKQSASDKTRSAKQAAAKKKKLAAKKYSRNNARATGKKAKKAVLNKASNSRKVGAPKKLLAPR